VTSNAYLSLSGRSGPADTSIGLGVVLISLIVPLRGTRSGWIESSMKRMTTAQPGAMEVRDDEDSNRDDAHGCHGHGTRTDDDGSSWWLDEPAARAEGLSPE
jgi:hypothetical protein